MNNACFPEISLVATGYLFLIGFSLSIVRAHHRGLTEQRQGRLLLCLGSP